MTTVHIFGLPIATCDLSKTWKAAADVVGRRLQARFGSAVQTVYVELYSPESFAFDSIVKLLQEGESPPFVTVDGRLVQAGGKLSEGRIAEELDRLFSEESLRTPEKDT